jgi:hypothetical protein
MNHRGNCAAFVAILATLASYNLSIRVIEVSGS